MSARGTVAPAAWSSEPALIEPTLELMLAESLPADETAWLPARLDATPERAEAVFRFLQRHWDALMARLPIENGAHLVWVGASACSASLRGEIADFFRERSASRRGGASNYAKAMDSMDGCIARRAAHGAALAAYLRRL